jgi:ABC-type taurine transport system ATPase subunit
MEHLYELKDVERCTAPRSAASAIDGINLLIEPADFLAIEGPAARARARCCNFWARFDRPSSGSIVFDGKHLSQMGDRELTAVRSRDHRVPVVQSDSDVERGGNGSGDGATERSGTSVRRAAELLTRRARESHDAPAVDVVGR